MQKLTVRHHELRHTAGPDDKAVVDSAVVAQHLACGALFTKDEEITHRSRRSRRIVWMTHCHSAQRVVGIQAQIWPQRQVDDGARGYVKSTAAALIAWSVCGQVPAAWGDVGKLISTIGA
ncbi:hypothetical protein D3C71_1071730 [compost metagenome]